MSLLLDSTAEEVNCASDTSLDNIDPCTTLAWIYPTTAFAEFAPNRTIFSKGDWVNGHTRLQLHVDDWPDVKMMAFIRGNISALQAQSIVTSSVTANKWSFVGAITDVGGSATDQKLFTGDLNTLATEVGSYSLQTAIGGSRITNASADYKLGVGELTAEVFFGLVGIVVTFDAVLSLGQIQQQQFHPHKIPSLVGFWDLYGTGTQPDYSGNGNNGTVTGATVADHVPLGPLFGFDVSVPYRVPAGVTYISPFPAFRRP